MRHEARHQVKILDKSIASMAHRANPSKSEGNFADCGKSNKTSLAWRRQRSWSNRPTGTSAQLSQWLKVAAWAGLRQEARRWGGTQDRRGAGNNNPAAATPAAATPAAATDSSLGTGTEGRGATPLTEGVTRKRPSTNIHNTCDRNRRAGQEDTPLHRTQAPEVERMLEQTGAREQAREGKWRDGAQDRRGAGSDDPAAETPAAATEPSPGTGSEGCGALPLLEGVMRKWPSTNTFKMCDRCGGAGKEDTTTRRRGKGSSGAGLETGGTRAPTIQQQQCQQQQRRTLREAKAPPESGGQMGGVE
ncbi:hypothetical protein BDR26DRAFT_940573 [Obelidium mucronatum]|nr:hypothetical protein BDR26DRAFT_940573 [Obelidium mucronatum]